MSNISTEFKILSDKFLSNGNTALDENEIITFQQLSSSLQSIAKECAQKLQKHIETINTIKKITNEQEYLDAREKLLEVYVSINSLNNATVSKLSSKSFFIVRLSTVAHLISAVLAEGPSEAEIKQANTKLEKVVLEEEKLLQDYDTSDDEGKRTRLNREIQNAQRRVIEAKKEIEELTGKGKLELNENTLATIRDALEGLLSKLTGLEYKLRRSHDLIGRNSFSTREIIRDVENTF